MSWTRCSPRPQPDGAPRYDTSEDHVGAVPRVRAQALHPGAACALMCVTAGLLRLHVMDLSNNPAGYRQVTLLLFDQRIAVVPYPPCSELFKALAFPADPTITPAVTEENYYQ